MSDSPWFWLLLFSLMGLGALGAIHGKYWRRQAGIERQYQARDRVARGVDVAQPDSPSAGEGDENAGTRPYSMPGENLIPLWPLAIVVGAGAAFSAGMLIRDRCRCGRPDSLTDSVE